MLLPFSPHGMCDGKFFFNWSSRTLLTSYFWYASEHFSPSMCKDSVKNLEEHTLGGPEADNGQIIAK